VGPAISGSLRIRESRNLLMQFTALSIANPNSEAAAEAVVVVYSRGGLGLDVVSLAIPPG